MKHSMIERIRPRTVINEHFDMEFRNSFYAIDYYCPTCGKPIAFYKSDNACDKCGTFFDWGEHKPEIKITRTVAW